MKLSTIAKSLATVAIISSPASAHEIKNERADADTYITESLELLSTLESETAQNVSTMLQCVQSYGETIKHEHVEDWEDTDGMIASSNGLLHSVDHPKGQIFVRVDSYGYRIGRDLDFNKPVGEFLDQYAGEKDLADTSIEFAGQQLGTQGHNYKGFEYPNAKNFYYSKEKEQKGKGDPESLFSELVESFNERCNNIV